MKRMIERLSPGEIGRAVRFANRQFDTDFLRLQPKLYRHPACGDTYVCTENTEICGMLSVYPYRYRGLRSLSIGTVCTAPEYRGQGVMRSLFAHLETHVFPQFDLLTLAGKKRLYEQFGFAKALCFPEYRYIPGKATPCDRVIQIRGHEADDILYSLYSQFGAGVSRSKGSLAELLKGNGRDIYFFSIAATWHMFPATRQNAGFWKYAGRWVTSKLQQRWRRYGALVTSSFWEKQIYSTGSRQKAATAIFLETTGTSESIIRSKCCLRLAFKRR